MKNKTSNNPKLQYLLEKSVVLILIIIIFSSFKTLSTINHITTDALRIKRIEKSISDNNKKLSEIKSYNKSKPNLSWMDYSLWVEKCASVSNLFIYRNLDNLSILSEKPQSELDKIGETLNIEEGGKNYNNLVKFIIIDKDKQTFLSNDLNNIDFIKKNLKKFSVENGELYNYISSRGKWYNLSYNSESSPASMVYGKSLVSDSKNFIEGYWFPKDYTYSEKEKPLIESIIYDLYKTTEKEITSDNTRITNFKNGIVSYKKRLVIYVVVFLVMLLFLYFLGKDRIKNGFKNILMLKVIKSIKIWFESRSTLFKLVTFILSSLFTIFLIILGLLNLKSTLILLFLVLFHFIFIFSKAIKFSTYLDSIIRGIEKITSGNLDHVIKENGDYSLSKLANNINKLNRGFKVSIEDQIKNEKLKSELVANVSHDLKTPLTSIINYTDILLREDISEEEREEYLKILNRKSLKLKNLIEDLFEISKINSGKMELKKSTVDIVELVNQSLAEYSDTDMYVQKELKFIFKSYAPKIDMNLDGKKLSRVLENLINNAIKYSLNNTRVYIEIEEISKGIRISFKNVSSTALDFDKKEIFERFTRGDKSRNSGIDGSGLGLAIAKSIVELHGGTMYIDFDGDLFKSIIELNFENIEEPFSDKIID
ncbi:sensor histidine kinase [Hathewaya massiliensis]|uniref:sensor histidine kinase n=1 Tax=Hathewaya massiliensis TaxID=1964382 RepID=UPI001159B36D|nr:HAMP domain-containing sensor histidine kinase [Hathewaya massiliensis]